MPPALVFDSVWKKFSRGERHDSLRDLIPALVKRIWHTPDGLEDREFWAIRDMSFVVGASSALGIVGANGAGKSTILKLLTRILKPTSGRCHVNGRVGALIEVASSFHPDLTGRENVYLQGAIMGMTRAETARRFDEIVEFAEVAPFIDTPVKRYSNGMNARLGFAVAAHLDPQVLIIDEVLSVGDLSFQERCQQRMLEFKRSGAAIVFVSHNVNAIAALCDTTMVVSAGRSTFIGPTEQALKHYLTGIHEGGEADSTTAVFERVTVVNAAGRPVTRCEPGAPLRITAHVRFRQAAHDVCFGFAVHQMVSAVCAYGADSRSLGLPLSAHQADDRLEVTFAFEAQLARGHYLVELCAKNASADVMLARSHPAAFLQVEESATVCGVADLRAQCLVRTSLDADVGAYRSSVAGARG